MSYIYGAPCKASNFNVVYIYIWTYVWQRWKPSLSICCTMFQLNQCRKFSCVTVVCKYFASYQGYPNYRWDLTLILLMSYIYEAPCKARNFNVVYIWTYVWQRWKPSLSTCCTTLQYLTNLESFPVSQLCVSTLPATKITLITDGI
jgi:hypothetical protein